VSRWSAFLDAVDRELDRSIEREPSYTPTHRTPRMSIALHRCSTCSKPLLSELPDATGRCVSCHERDARASTCCGFLYAGETCECELV
jgi:hypothetical protein